MHSGAKFVSVCKKALSCIVAAFCFILNFLLMGVVSLTATSHPDITLSHPAQCSAHAHAHAHAQLLKCSTAQCSARMHEAGYRRCRLSPSTVLQQICPFSHFLSFFKLLLKCILVHRLLRGNLKEYKCDARQHLLKSNSKMFSSVGIHRCHYSCYLTKPIIIIIIFMRTIVAGPQ